MARCRILRIPQACYAEMIEQVMAERPNECCGLLAGVLDEKTLSAQVERAYRLVNALASPVRYCADGRELCRVHRDMRERNLDLLAVYHSHPTSAAVPSRTDHEQWANGSEVMCLIVSLLADPPSLRGWWLEDGRHEEAVWEVA
jgi:proteasome lid subunit RPN8/RPN11